MLGRIINPLQVLLINLLLLYCKFLHAEEGLRLITAPTFASYESIKSVPEDDWYHGQDVSYADDSVWLNPDPRESQTRAVSNIGKIIYKDKVQFKYADYGMISFKSSFTFQIITTNPYPNCGSGMAFFIADYDKAPERSYGRYLGLVRPNATYSYRFFAVEFDTHISEEFADPSGSHIGIDINSLKSIKYVDSNPNSSNPELCLYNNLTFQVWIEYNASASLIQVWMTNSSSAPQPSSPCLSLKYNLSDVFQDYMYVGFSASSNASDDSMEGHVLYAWNLTTYPPTSSGNKLLIPLVVTLSGAVFLCICFVLLYHIPRAIKKRKGLITVHNQGHFPQIASSSRAFIEKLVCQSTLMEYSYEELVLASDNFASSNKIGEGTFSMVYKATLVNGQTVAIKRLKEGCRKELDFSTEIHIISNLRHKNLLPLLGWCYIDEGEALLVYEYMRRGSLNHHLYGKDKGTLSSKVRLDILLGVASALEYLHKHVVDRVLHRDVKAANVLLTEDFLPMLGDFGLARLIRHDEHSVTMTAAGSPGYVAPEVVFSNKATDKADVYSYGVLVLVVACGRPAMLESASCGLESEGMRLVDWIWILYRGNQLMDALDPTITIDMSDLERSQWRRVLHLALMCVNPSPKLRPTMRQVCQALQGETFLWIQPLPAIGPSLRSQSWRSASEALYLDNKWSVPISPYVNGISNPPVGQLSPTSLGYMSPAIFCPW
ncbi:hypothetical protein GOP47_0012975 [Adiantum capillus-veneris]|uniref:Protein kinase domain-containing protein n=1 Tax=Adiantum capillus-veneris TaxID=13818 RepID=A0A9D4US49_ADICA|nr:hypothetical protein GOP47_0012975 [Adiantum capillus-veneris]